MRFRRMGKGMSVAAHQPKVVVAVLKNQVYRAGDNGELLAHVVGGSEHTEELRAPRLELHVCIEPLEKP